jgi:preprotein translocase subunit YajC
MFITEVHAAETGTPTLPAAPSAGEAFAWNMGMVLVLVAMFYVLLILPQQRRFKEHSAMLNALKKGDKVLTTGGLIGTIDKINDGDEVIIDLGNGLKVTALRSAIQAKDDPLKRRKVANDQKK